MMTLTYTLNGETKIAHIKDDVKLTDMLAHAQAAADLCYEPHTGEYHGELRWLMVKYAQLKLLTDIELPDNVDEIYPIVRAIDFDALGDSCCQLEDFEKIFCNIIYQRNDMRHQASVERSLASIAESVKTTCNKINSVTESASALITQAAPVLSKEKMTALLAALQQIQQNGIDESKLVDAVFAKQNTKKPRKTTKRTKVVDLPKEE